MHQSIRIEAIPNMTEQLANLMKTRENIEVKATPDGYSTRVRLAADFSTLMFLTSAAYYKIFGRRLTLLHSFDEQCFYIDFDLHEITEEMVATLENEVRSMVTKNITIDQYNVDKNELIEYFDAIEFHDKVDILENFKNNQVKCLQVNDYIDICYNPITSDLTRLCAFDYRFTDNGFYLRIPALMANGQLAEWEGEPKMHKLYRDLEKWSHKIKSKSIPQLNNIVDNSLVSEINTKCDTFSKNELEGIAMDLISHFPAKRLITIAGPSSSGKSTFSRLIRQQIEESGFDCLVVAMDNYYKMRTIIPTTPDGLKDFECIEAFDVDLLASRLQAILRGERVPNHTYSFVTGINTDTEDFLELNQKGFLILEGIHGINPEFLERLGERDTITAIYVAPMTPLSIDTNDVFPQSDLRLIRRIIRDDRQRGYLARETIRQWTSVRIGEERNITPNISKADLTFNSSLVYELSVLTDLCLPLLDGALTPIEGEDATSVNAHEVNDEVHRLKNLLSLIHKLPLKKVPKESCLLQFLTE